MWDSTFARTIYNLLEPGEHGRRGNLIVDRIIVGLILINVTAVILESFPDIANRYAVLLRVVEVISVSIFTVEYAGRIFIAHLKFQRRTVCRSIVAFILSPMAIVDLAAILPFYLPFVIAVDLRFLRILRLSRLLRVLKINRYTSALSLIGRVLKRKASELIVTVFVTLLLLLLASSLMYYIEMDDQPEAFPNIIAAFWWAVATLTTVGYGDVYPVTALGKVLAGIIAVLGIGLVALPTGIVSSGFLDLLQDKGKAGVRAARRGRVVSRQKTYRKTRARAKKDQRKPNRS